MQFIEVTPLHPLRQRVETCIRDVYAHEYGANLTEFPELLVALINDEGEAVCAAGLRFSEDGYFSERYLSSPIESLLDKVWASPVHRNQIAEITSLAGKKPGACLMLFKHIVALFRERSVPWAFFTATDRLRVILRRSGVPALDFGEASPESVDDPTVWGSYYATAPRVAAVHDSMLSIVPPSMPAVAHEAAVSA